MTAKAKQPDTYQLQYHATINPDTEQAEVQITLPDAKLINSIDFKEKNFFEILFIFFIFKSFGGIGLIKRINQNLKFVFNPS